MSSKYSTSPYATVQAELFFIWNTERYDEKMLSRYVPTSRTFKSCPERNTLILLILELDTRRLF